MQHVRRAFALIAASLVAACAAGGSPGGEPCAVGADCVSGVCEDGHCKGTMDGSGGSGASGGGGAMGGGGAGQAGGSGGAGEGGSSSNTGGGSGVCAPNHDGTITRAEVPLAAGLSAKFEDATHVTFATSGTMNPDGSRDWNLAGAFSGDHLELVETQDLSGKWFAGDFAGATYAAKLSDTSDLLGIFEVTADALLLRGVASPTGGVQKTELTYDPPVVALQFPLSMGTTFATDANVTGYAQGVYVIYTESYTSSVDAHGTLETPFGTFPVLRVKTKLTRTVGALVTVVRSFAFASECFGTVATITSTDNETQDEFSDVAELARLAP